MADFIFNIAKGAFVEKIRDSDSVVGVLLLKAAEADDVLNNYDELAALLAAAGNTEADFTNYARKTGLTGTITVDDTNNRVDVDLVDQTFTAAGGASNNTLTDAIVFYEEAAADSTRIPLACLDAAVTTDGNDLTLQFNAAGFGRAA
jgi:hypothetical protein